MIDLAQIALILVIFLLTILLLALGIQVFFILKDFRQTIQKANKVLDNTDTITENVATPISSLSSIVKGIKTGVSLVSLLKGNKKNKHKQ